MVRISRNRPSTRGWVNLCHRCYSCSTSSYNYSCEYEWFSLYAPTLNLVSHMQSLHLCAESIGGTEWQASWPRFVTVAAVATSVTTCGCGITVWACFVWTCLHLHLWTTCSCGWTILKFICICGLLATIWTVYDAYCDICVMLVMLIWVGYQICDQIVKIGK